MVCIIDLVDLFGNKVQQQSAATKCSNKVQGVLGLWRGHTATLLHRMPYSAVNFAIFENTVKALSPLLKATSEGGTLASEVCFLLVCVLVCAEAAQQMHPNREAKPRCRPNSPLLLGHAKAPCCLVVLQILGM